MKRFHLLLVLTLFLAGCTAIPALFSPTISGVHQQQHMQNVTVVNLSGQNYRIVKTNITGRSRGFSLLGFITIVSPDYLKAVSRMYKDSGMELGHSQALANIAQYDTSSYFILFSIPEITLRSDLVEFVGPAPPVSTPVATSP